LSEYIGKITELPGYTGVCRCPYYDRFLPGLIYIFVLDNFENVSILEDYWISSFAYMSHKDEATLKDGSQFSTDMYTERSHLTQRPKHIYTCSNRLNNI